MVSATRPALHLCMLMLMLVTIGHASSPPPRSRRSLDLQAWFTSLSATKKPPTRSPQPTWRVHNYHGIELRPVQSPVYESPPAVSYGAPSEAKESPPSKWKFPLGSTTTPNPLVTSYGVPVETKEALYPPADAYNKLPSTYPPAVETYVDNAPRYVQTTKTFKFPLKKFPHVEISTEDQVPTYEKTNSAGPAESADTASALQALDELETLSNLGNLLPQSIADNVDPSTLTSVLGFLNSKNTDSQPIDFSALLQLAELVPSFDLSSNNLDLESLIKLIPSADGVKSLKPSGPFSKFSHKKHPKLLALLKVLKSLKKAEIAKLGTILGLKKFHKPNHHGIFKKLGGFGTSIAAFEAGKAAKFGLVGASLFGAKKKEGPFAKLHSFKKHGPFKKLGPLKKLGLEIDSKVKFLTGKLKTIPKSIAGLVGVGQGALPSVPFIKLATGYRLKPDDGGPYVKISYPKARKAPSPLPVIPTTYPTGPYPEPRDPVITYTVPQTIQTFPYPAAETPAFQTGTYPEPNYPPTTYSAPQDVVQTGPYPLPNYPPTTYTKPQLAIAYPYPAEIPRPQQPSETYRTPETMNSPSPIYVEPQDTAVMEEEPQPQSPQETYATPAFQDLPSKPAETYNTPPLPSYVYRTPDATYNLPQIPQPTYSAPGLKKLPPTPLAYEAPQTYQEQQPSADAYGLPTPKETYRRTVYRLPQTYTQTRQAQPTADVPDAPQLTLELPKASRRSIQYPVDVILDDSYGDFSEESAMVTQGDFKAPDTNWQVDEMVATEMGDQEATEDVVGEREPTREVLVDNERMESTQEGVNYNFEPSEPMSDAMTEEREQGDDKTVDVVVSSDPLAVINAARYLSPDVTPVISVSQDYSTVATN